MEKVFEALEFAKPLIQLYAGDLGFFVQLVTLVGTFRLIDKPLMVLLHTIVAATPSKKDDEQLQKVLASPAYKAFRFFVDYLLSLKLPKEKK